MADVYGGLINLEVLIDENLELVSTPPESVAPSSAVAEKTSIVSPEKNNSEEQNKFIK